MLREFTWPPARSWVLAVILDFEKAYASPFFRSIFSISATSSSSLRII
jgi:hypothetical protein